MIINMFKNEYHFLSNFYEAQITWDGRIWLSTEHAYQAAKTLDPISQEKIHQALTPAVAKKLGKKVRIRDDWDEIKISVMTEIVSAKFTQNQDLRDKLIATGDATLIEGNWWGDTFWGICGGQGQNHLGKILMKIREELK